ncbi:hypothetical protein [Mesorhizobium sp. M1163]|uniref:hypothetical protein n=1 Tax=Mesorhizobium sp. M1163 TaxID=2957065 RepID=UPI00333BA592
MELEIRKIADPTSCGLIMQRNKVHHVYTVDRVARDLGVSEALIQDLTLGLEPEDGVIWVYGPTMTTGSWPSPMKASRRSNSSSKNIIASPHRKLDQHRGAQVLLAAGWPDAHVCGLHRMRTDLRTIAQALQFGFDLRWQLSSARSSAQDLLGNLSMCGDLENGSSFADDRGF